MSEVNNLVPRHLVIVRHGESEGDVRRAAWRQGNEYETFKHPADEDQTELGAEQSILAGQWIGRHVLQAYALSTFDACMVSPMSRTRQSAISLGLSETWQDSPLLAERDRGKVAGLTRAAHQSLFPESYANMKKYPFYWVPPDGESILRVADRATRFLAGTRRYQNLLVMTHRDWIWAAHMPLEDASLETMETMDTDQIHNGQVLHYTNINPYSGKVDGERLSWKRSVCPWAEQEGLSANASEWQACIPGNTVK